MSFRLERAYFCMIEAFLFVCRFHNCNISGDQLIRENILSSKLIPFISVHSTVRLIHVENNYFNLLHTCFNKLIKALIYKKLY